MSQRDLFSCELEDTSELVCTNPNGGFALERRQQSKTHALNLKSVAHLDK